MWRGLIILSICFARCLLSAMVEQSGASSSSEILDQKEFQRATAESGDVVYARALETQRAARKEAEDHVQRLQQMTFQEVSANIAESTEPDVVQTDERVSATRSVNPTEFSADEKRVRLLYGVVYAIFGVLGGWIVFWLWRKVFSTTL